MSRWIFLLTQLVKPPAYLPTLTPLSPHPYPIPDFSHLVSLLPIWNSQSAEVVSNHSISHALGMVWITALSESPTWATGMVKRATDDCRKRLRAQEGRCYHMAERSPD